MTPEQKSSLLLYAQMWENAPVGNAAAEQYDAMEAYVTELLAQARADGMEAAAKVCDMHGEDSESGHSDCQGCGEILAAEIRAQARKGGGNG